MKKKGFVVLLAAGLVLAGYILYMETHFATFTAVDTGLSEEKILREMPEIAIREQDLALETYILSLSQVQERLARTGTDGFGEVKTEPVPLKEAKALLSDWTDEGWQATEIAVSQGTFVYVSFSKEDGTANVHYAFFADGSYPPQKSIGVYGRTLFQDHACKAIYENINGEITKMKHKQVWFAWLTGEKLRKCIYT